MKENSLLRIAKYAALEAAKIHKKYFKSIELQVVSKEKSYDRLTTSDIEAEKEIVRCIKKEYPLHNIMGEEEDYESNDSEYLWVIDPLDGTNNFSAGFPVFSVSIAVYKQNKAVIGVVYDVLREEMFSAQLNGGAFLNDIPISVSQVELMADALLITGFYYERGEMMKKTLDQMRQFFEKEVIGIRRTGSAALDLCYIAAGRATGYWELQLSPWDFAAGRLIVEEAGGSITNTKNCDLGLKKEGVLATNGRIHNLMLSVINQNT
tara:strand:+ start:1923 stop:2714 length:792 start_codon:yes stop_codon:yes gene_type:complete